MSPITYERDEEESQNNDDDEFVLTAIHNHPCVLFLSPTNDKRSFWRSFVNLHLLSKVLKCSNSSMMNRIDL